MAELCAVNSDLSRKSQSQILRRLASAGQNSVGEAIGKSETWVSRFASEQLKTCADLLTVLGLKVVPIENECHSADYIRSLRCLARIGMDAHDEAEPGAAGTLIQDFEA